MTASISYLRLNCLSILQGSHVAYEESFHAGVNIVRGQNGSGKSTLADFIFFILGGEFDNWKDAAGSCTEVQAEIQTPRGKLTLKREIKNHQQPILVYFGAITEARESTVEGWESFPIRRQANRESFSQVMFRSMHIPEAQSERASNITMHQLLRLCYSDQRTPAQRLFRLETFDTHSIREAVGDLICGVNDFELYEVTLELREQQKKLEEVHTQLRMLQHALNNDDEPKTPERIDSDVEALRREADRLREEIDQVEELVESDEAKTYLAERQSLQADLINERNEIAVLESTEKNLQFELREIEQFVAFIGELEEKIGFAEATSDVVGSIEFTHCPACGEELQTSKGNSHCILCKSPIDADRDKSRYNQIRLDLEIQARESRQLIEQKRGEKSAIQRKLRNIRREHEKTVNGVRSSLFTCEWSARRLPFIPVTETRTNRS